MLRCVGNGDQKKLSKNPRRFQSKILGQIRKMGEAFLLTVGAFLLTVELPCLQSLKVLIRCIFPL